MGGGMKNPSIYMEPMTEQDRDDDQEFQRIMKLKNDEWHDDESIRFLINLIPPNFDNAPFREKPKPEIITDEVRFARSSAREYFMSTRGSGKPHLYDHRTFVMIYKGIK